MNINIIGSITQLGYGLVTTNLIDQLDKLGHRVSLFHINRGHIDPRPEHVDVIQRATNNSFNPDFNAPCIRIWHQNDMTLFCGNGRKIGFPFFELSEFNPQEISHLSHLDDIIVATHWAKEVIEANGIKVPVHVVPSAADSSVFNHVGCTFNGVNPFRFLIAGKWEYRKGHDVALKAFNEAFSEDDNVELICLTQNPNLSPEDNDDWNRTFKTSKLGEKIQILPRVPTQTNVADIMKSVDCGLFPARAEGWNLEATEMMSCGKPIIITDYSGHTEFCNSSNSLLIPKQEMEVAFDGHYFTKDIGSWMKITDDNFQTIVQYMRDVASKPYSNGGFDSKEIANSIKNFTWENSAKKLVDILEN